MTVNNNKKSKNGFTIIELLVVVSIMVILGVIFTNILIDALRGRNKVKAINQVKQNGQVVLDQLSNEIRNADGVVCVGKFIDPTDSNVVNNTIVVTNGGTYTQFRFIPPNLTSTPPSNGKIQKINFIRSDLADGTLDSSLCSSQDFITGGANYKQSLTDSDPVNGVSVTYTPIASGGYEDVFKKNGDNIIIENIIIKFNASAGVSAGYAYDVTVVDGGIPFSTSVQIRGVVR